MLGNQAQLSFYSLMDLIYPVGSYYITESSDLSDATKMATKFDGTWEQLEAGRFLEACSSGAGTNKAPGIPDIRGSHRTGFYPKDVGGSNCFKTSSTNDNGWTGSTSQSGIGWANFVAANGEYYNGTYANNVYGKSNTVQPKSRTVYIYKRTGLAGGLTFLEAFCISSKIKEDM